MRSLPLCSVLLLLLPAAAFDARGLVWMREAEKKHARAAMVALPSLMLIASATGEDPVPWLNAQPAATQLGVYAAVGALEALNLRRLDRGFALKPGEVPGRVFPWVDAGAALHTIEDEVGRVAMLATAGVLVESLCQNIDRVLAI